MMKEISRVTLNSSLHLDQTAKDTLVRIKTKTTKDSAFLQPNLTLEVSLQNYHTVVLLYSILGMVLFKSILGMVLFNTVPLWTFSNTSPDGFPNCSTIFSKLVEVPTINPKKANTIIMQFLAIIKLPRRPFNEYQ